ncbi:MAG: hypothetical protein IT450_04675 [Phycisphaerales bacterium]|nr:hypothetical protein [Phycisphaerales bacterium]
MIRMAAFLTGVAIVASGLADGPYLKIDDHTLVPARASAAWVGDDWTQTRGVGCCGAPDAFSGAAMAWTPQAVPGGGTLNTLAFMNPAVINNTREIAFISRVNGSTRNQGVFVAGPAGLRVIARGCGDGGGGTNPGSCGDASPIGGTFSGFYDGTVFAPVINDNGDVLFYCDVFGGSALRGVFLYRAATQDIIKVVALGDASPLGGVFENVSPGSMNNSRVVVFAGRRPGQGEFQADFYKWESGVITKVAALGDPAPGGGVFSFLNREWFGFVDGTSIPIGPIPAINNSGQIAFAAVVSGGPVERGLILSDGVNHQWAVRNTDTTPLGGNYVDLAGPNLTDSGKIAFYADVRLANGSFTGGWFSGEPGNLRTALSFFQPVGGGECFGLAWCRNPMRAIDDCGNVLLWTNIRFPNLTEREAVVLSTVDGEVTVLAQQGLPTPIGGSFGSMNGWITMNNERQMVVSAGTPGASGGRSSVHFVYDGLRIGDLDNDGTVGIADLAILLSNFGTGGNTFADGDANGDGFVNLEDLAQLLGAFGTSC